MNRYDDQDEPGYPPSWGEPWQPVSRRRGRPAGRRTAGGAPRSGRRRGRLGWLGWSAVGLTAVLVAGALYGYAKIRTVMDSVGHVTISKQALGKRPPKLNGSTNILVIGSDSRAGTHGYGSASVIQGSRSDTVLLLHISPNHKHAVVVSFPRDSVVPIYACPADGQGHNGQQAAAGVEQLNSTFAYGGVQCLWHTIEKQTNIYINHFVEVDFNGFKSIVNDLGGVSVCLPFSVDVPQSGLHLTAGKHNITGNQALAFVRTREGIGLGSDLQRIQRQQFFLAAVAQKLKSSNLLGNPVETFNVVRDTARSLSTDASLTMLAGIANSVRGLSTKDIRFVTVPNVDYPPNPNWIEWEQPYADQLFRAIAADKTLPKAKKTSAVPTVSPSKVSVDVLNGSGTGGLAATTATALSGRGFTVTGQGDASSYNYTKSVIQYSSASQVPEVNTLKAQIGSNVTVQLDASLKPGALNFIIGSDFSSLTAAKSSTTSVASLSKSTYGGISASTNICKDAAAFSGPDTVYGG